MSNECKDIKNYIAHSRFKNFKLILLGFYLFQLYREVIFSYSYLILYLVASFWVFFSADIRMEKITVNIHIPYLQSLYQFFMQALEKDTPTTPTPRDSTSTDGEDVLDSPTPEPQPTGVFTLYGTIKQPEFILHGSAGATDDRILVLGVSCPL